MIAAFCSCLWLAVDWWSPAIWVPLYWSIWYYNWSLIMLDKHDPLACVSYSRLENYNSDSSGGWSKRRRISCSCTANRLTSRWCRFFWRRLNQNTMCMTTQRVIMPAVARKTIFDVFLDHDLRSQKQDLTSLLRTSEGSEYAFLSRMRITKLFLTLNCSYSLMSQDLWWLMV